MKTKERNDKIRAAYRLINHPAQAGRVWARYPIEQVQKALEILRDVMKKPEN